MKSYRKLIKSKLIVLCPTQLGKYNEANKSTPHHNIYCYRVIVFPTGLDFLTNLPPNLSIPEDNIWEVFVTVVRYKTVVMLVCLRILRN